MKNLISIIFFLFGIFSIAQNNELETHLSFEVGAIGAWVSFEQPLNNKFLLHAEFGQEFGFYRNLSNSNTQFIATNTLSLEPRYYYNREKRKELGKSIAINTGNYLALEIQHIPDWMTYSSDDNINISKATSVIPKIGMKRRITNFSTFELAGGIGYQWSADTRNSVAVGLDIKLNFVLFNLTQLRRIINNL
jgi:hypothetical protein